MKSTLKKLLFGLSVIFIFSGMLMLGSGSIYADNTDNLVNEHTDGSAGVNSSTMAKSSLGSIETQSSLSLIENAAALGDNKDPDATANLSKTADLGETANLSKIEDLGEAGGNDGNADLGKTDNLSKIEDLGENGKNDGNADLGENDGSEDPGEAGGNGDPGTPLDYIVVPGETEGQITILPSITVVKSGLLGSDKAKFTLRYGIWPFIKIGSVMLDNNPDTSTPSEHTWKNLLPGHYILSESYPDENDYTYTNDLGEGKITLRLSNKKIYVVNTPTNPPQEEPGCIYIEKNLSSGDVGIPQGEEYTFKFFVYDSAEGGESVGEAEITVGIYPGGYAVGTAQVEGLKAGKEYWVAEDPLNGWMNISEDLNEAGRKSVVATACQEASASSPVLFINKKIMEEPEGCIEINKELIGNGIPAEGTYTFKFDVYDVEEGGVPVVTENITIDVSNDTTGRAIVNGLELDKEYWVAESDSAGWENVTGGLISGRLKVKAGACNSASTQSKAVLVADDDVPNSVTFTNEKTTEEETTSTTSASTTTTAPPTTTETLEVLGVQEESVVRSAQEDEGTIEVLGIAELPFTGQNSGLFLMGSALLLAGASIMAILIIKRRKNVVKDS